MMQIDTFADKRMKILYATLINARRDGASPGLAMRPTQFLSSTLVPDQDPGMHSWQILKTPSVIQTKKGMAHMQLHGLKMMVDIDGKEYMAKVLRCWQGEPGFDDVGLGGCVNPRPSHSIPFKVYSQTMATIWTE